jgi:hypothetical protein
MACLGIVSSLSQVNSSQSIPTLYNVGDKGAESDGGMERTHRTLTHPLQALTHYPPTLPLPQPTKVLSTPLYGDPMDTHDFGKLYSHTSLDGLFMIVYMSEFRIGLHSFTNGKIRYINKDTFRSQYTPLAQDASCK